MNGKSSRNKSTSWPMQQELKFGPPYTFSGNVDVSEALEKCEAFTPKEIKPSMYAPILGSVGGLIASTFQKPEDANRQLKEHLELTQAGVDRIKVNQVLPTLDAGNDGNLANVKSLEKTRNSERAKPGTFAYFIDQYSDRA